MKTSLRFGVVVLCCLAGAFLSVSLLFQHHGEELGTAAVNTLCGGGEDAGCQNVNQSTYSEVAGVPLAGIGLVFYISILTLASMAWAGGGDVRALAGGTAFALLAIALVIDLRLFALQAFSIRAYCKLCLATYALNALSLAMLWPMRRGLGAIRTTLGSPAGRIAVVGWIVATAAAGLGVAGVEAALEEREASRAANILGGPIPAAPARSGGDRAELEAAQSEVRRLRETLDDPQKYADYQTNKTLKEFASIAPSALNLETTPFTGPKDARISIAIYSDFLCPFCRQVAQGFHSYLPNTAGRVALYYKFYPLDTCNPALAGKAVHPGACWLAYGGVCAQEQGKFWPYHDRVFAGDLPKGALDRALVEKIAGQLGLDENAFGTCLVSPRTRDRVVADIDEGTRAGVKVTPTLFINKRRLPDLNATLQAIDEESKRLGLGPMPAEPVSRAGH